MPEARTTTALELMMRFAEHTGILSGERGRRYLWTDAFAVCNFLGLERATSDPQYRALALRLVDQVHHELGRFREDDARAGWISGLGEQEGEQHPTRGGLRIGKALPERPRGEDYDPDLEWDRDGQYFHYLTQWVHALDQASRATLDPKLHLWARELMHTAHRSFVHGARGRKGMYWKLSTDRSRPLVAASGHHDPLEGLATCTELEATARELRFSRAPSLIDAMDDFGHMVVAEGLATSDPLGLGGLLVATSRLLLLEPVNQPVVASLLASAVVSMQGYLAHSDLRAPAEHRLAFRELGLAIGLAGVAILRNDPWIARLDDEGRRGLAELTRFSPLRERLESFWLTPEHRHTATWREHEDINEVMLATSLVPDGFLGL